MSDPGMPLRGRPLLQSMGRMVMRMWGWRFEGDLPRLPRFIIIVAPHTSNWDFVIGVFAMFGLDLRIHWFGKDTLFRPPFGWILRLIDGRPIRRSSNEGVVAEVAAAFRAEPQFLLALSPEGTRTHVDHWRTGFYRIAEAAAVPIVPVCFDWSRRVIGIEPPFFVTGDISRDMTQLKAIYRPEMARNRAGY